MLAHPEAPVGATAEAVYRDAIERRLRGEPVAYLRGIEEFHGIALAVDPRALIPRPETERVVDLALDEVMAADGRGPTGLGGPPQVIDIGTGSGADRRRARRRVAGAARAPEDVLITAFDVDPGALDLENAVGHAVGDRLRFDGGDLLPPVGAGPWEVIAANLPYVRSDAMAGLPAPTHYEPALALDGGPDGLAVIDRLLDRLPTGWPTAGSPSSRSAPTRGRPSSTMSPRTCRAGRAASRDLAGLPEVAVIERAP